MALPCTDRGDQVLRARMREAGLQLTLETLLEEFASGIGEVDPFVLYALLIAQELYVHRYRNDIEEESS